jgi:hypothetical protein
MTKSSKFIDTAIDDFNEKDKGLRIRSKVYK